MYALFPLLLVLVSGNGLYGQEQDQDRHWQDIMASRISHIESLITLKDQRIDQLETNLQNQASEISSLRRLIEGKDTVMAKLLGQFANLQKRVDTIANKDSDVLRGNLSKDRTLFSSESHIMTNWTFDVQEEPGVITASSDSGEIRDQAGTKQLRRSPKSNRVAPVSSHGHTPVAFHAIFTTTKYLGEQSTVVFNQEKLDLGNGYNPQDGIYTVPESGTYVFTWTMLADVYNAFQNFLIVNGQRRGTSWTDSDESNDWHQATATVITTVSKGDHVFIQMGLIYHGKVFSQSNRGQPSFSGWKLA